MTNVDRVRRDPHDARTGIVRLTAAEAPAYFADGKTMDEAVRLIIPHRRQMSDKEMNNEMNIIASINLMSRPVRKSMRQHYDKGTGKS